MQTILNKNVTLYEANKERFFDFFSVHLSKFWNHLTGFDVIKFSDWLKPHKTESLADTITRRWGPDAVALCRTLIGFKK
jgi:hypothetical protein